MACYEVNLISVKLKAENKDFLLKALEALNWYPREFQNTIRTNVGTIYLDDGIFETTSIAYANTLNREYSKEVIKHVSKVNRWGLKVDRKNTLKGKMVKY